MAPGGKAYRLDITDDMLDLARKNREKAGVEKTELLKGEVEDVPLLDGHVDLVTSNCVINLSTDNERVIAEAFWVLKPGVRFVVSDVVFLREKGSLSAGVARSVELWSGYVSGAPEKSEYEDLLTAAGFEDVSVEVTHTPSPELIEGLGSSKEVEALREVPVPSAFIRDWKPEELGWETWRDGS